MRYWNGFILLLVLGAAACGGSGGGGGSGETVWVGTAPVAATGPAAAEVNRDAQPDVPMLVYLSVYQINVPFGVVSRSDEFWKHIDEQAVEDDLEKNGLRVGQGRRADWAYFKAILEKNPAETHQRVYSASGFASAELGLKEDVAEQVTCYFDPRNVEEVRSYDESANMLEMEFGPTLHELGDMHLRLCPLTRSKRTHLEIGEREDGSRQFSYVADERYYDLKIEADISLDNFLVVAPSREASWDFTIGHNFLVHEGTTEKVEQVLLFVPQLYRLDEKPAKEEEVKVTSKPAG